jgi:hypothetical protein
MRKKEQRLWQRMIRELGEQQVSVRTVLETKRELFDGCATEWQESAAGAAARQGLRDLKNAVRSLERAAAALARARQGWD